MRWLRRSATMESDCRRGHLHSSAPAAALGGSMNAIRIVIADDRPVFRFGLRALLNAMPDTEVVGEVTSGEEVIALAGSVRPDVILMDINMPGVNGIEATRRICETNSDIRILMVTMLEDDSIFAAMRAGARGYVVKGVE